MNDVNVNISFISEKVAKIRFCPEQFGETEDFITGSFGVAGRTSIKYWKLFHHDGLDEDNEYVPKSVASIPVPADVTGLEFLDFNNVVAVTADGSLNVIYIFRDRTENNMKEHITLKNLHRFACSGVSILEEQIATVGDDGV